MFKTHLEAQVIQFSNVISSKAHVEVMKKIRPGMKEYQLEAIFKQYAYFYVRTGRVWTRGRGKEWVVMFHSFGMHARVLGLF